MIFFILGGLLIGVALFLKVMDNPFTTLIAGVGFILLAIGFVRRLILKDKVKERK